MQITRAAEREADGKIEVALEFAECKPSLSDMIDIVFLEAHLCLGSQRARLLAGLIDEPDQDQIERAARLLAVRTFLENCKTKPSEAIAWLRGRSNG